jgi:hypothetical protein
MPAVSAVKLGINAKVYRNTGTYGSPTWTAIDLVRDASMNLPWDFGEASARVTKVKLYAPTQIDFNIQITVRMDDADTAYNALWDAMVTPVALDLLVLDGPVTTEGVRGVRCHFYVSLTGIDQGIGAVEYANFDLKAGFHVDGVPKAIEVGAASALTATNPG